MAINTEVFLEDLYTEHLEEAAYLYQLRCAWLNDKELGWLDIERLDVTTEAHIDALMIGEGKALDVCLNVLPEAEFETLHVIVRVFCRHRMIEHLAKLWATFDFDDADKIRAVADALKWDCPSEWYPHLLAVFKGPRKEMYPVLAPAVMYCAMRPEQLAFYSALSRTAPEHIPTMLKVHSRCAEDSASCIAQIQSYLTHERTEVVVEASLALLRLGESRALQICRRDPAKFASVLAVGGGKEDVTRLLQIAQKGTADGDCLLALGWCGDLSAVQFLVNYLKHPDHAPMAAQALQLMTGAGLYEDVHVPDEVTDDELFEHEQEAYLQGKLPKNIDGNPYGDEVQQLTLNQKTWLDWLQSHSQHFSAGVRYRNGRPFTVSELVRNLIDNQSSFWVRSMAYQELVIRYQLAIHFEVDDLIERQKYKLNEIAQWAKTQEASITPGVWYFAGAPMI